ncbi:MAG: histidinol-phosphatase [Rhodospirillaceae bacterium]|nr:MAG: histidinol-phosphatase [Rhodospirillaceae bacterium]
MTQGGFAAHCLALVHELADASGKIALRHFRTPITVDEKSDASPVTIADRDAEAVMRELIRRTFPDHGIIGEEHGNENTGAEWVWTLDPIDGTVSFINGAPLFGTLIALLHQGKPWLGCINHPALNERWVGGASEPTRRNGELVRTRPCATLRNATLYSTGPEYLSADTQAAAFARLEKAIKRRRFGGTDCYHYAMVASGWIDIACEAGLKLHDYAAVVPVVEAAGGIVTDWSGQPLTMASDGDVIALGDPRLHNAAVKLLSG